jgi:hypothetical protein
MDMPRPGGSVIIRDPEQPHIAAGRFSASTLLRTLEASLITRLDLVYGAPSGRLNEVVW